MVTTLDLQLLQSVRDFPAVSLLCSAGSSPEETRSRLDAQAREADARLAKECDEVTADQVGRRLRDQIATLEPVAAPSLAVFASREVSRWMAVPFELRDRVVVDATFATRDLVHAHARLRRYLVLLLDEQHTMLYEGRGPTLEPVHEEGFPLDWREDGPDTQDDERPRRTERSDHRDAGLQRYVRAVDEPLGPLIDAEPAPVVVVGAQRRVQEFQTSSSHARHVLASVAWVPDRRPVRPQELADTVAPHVEQVLAAERDAALRQLDDARGARRYSSGIDEVYGLARDGRGDLLVVEESFEYAALHGHDSPHLQPATDPTAPGVIDDAVDEAIENVLRHRGRTVIVPDGTLADHGRIAMTLRH